MMPRMRFDGGVGFGALEIAWIVLIALIWIGIIAAIILGIRWAIRSGRGTGMSGPPPGAPPTAPRPDDPLEILRQRYARGEIDDEEFERRRRTLGG